ncbi:MAG TPA: hypothetical protein VGD81_12730 [Opitutaceae bacterium]
MNEEAALKKLELEQLKIELDSSGSEFRILKRTCFLAVIYGGIIWLNSESMVHKLQTTVLYFGTLTVFFMGLSEHSRFIRRKFELISKIQEIEKAMTRDK